MKVARHLSMLVAALALVAGDCGGDGTSVDDDVPAVSSTDGAADGGSSTTTDATATTTGEGATGPVVSFVDVVTCHDENEAGGNSDIHVVFEVDDEVDEIVLSGSAGEQGAISGTGAAVEGLVVVRLPAVAYGEEVGIASVEAGGRQLDPSELGIPAEYVVPDDSGSDCRYAAAAEASAA